jgi:hypothetical protein
VKKDMVKDKHYHAYNLFSNAFKNIGVSLNSDVPGKNKAYFSMN